MSLFLDNRDLLERFRAGDRDALATVYEHYVDLVSVLARRGFTMATPDVVYVTGAPDVNAERELIQDTFVRAFSEKARLAYDGLRPYRPYLLRITKNLMIDRYRTSRRPDAVGAGNIDEILERGAGLIEGDPLEDDIAWRQMRAATVEFVAALDPEMRAFVRHRFEDEQGQEAVARLLGCSRRRVRTLEERVQRGLRRHLAKLGIM